MPYIWTEEKERQLFQCTREHFSFLPANEPSFEYFQELPIGIEREPLADFGPSDWTYNTWILSPESADFMLELIPGEFGIPPDIQLMDTGTILEPVAKNLNPQEFTESLQHIQPGTWKAEV